MVPAPYVLGNLHLMHTLLHDEGYETLAWCSVPSPQPPSALSGLGGEKCADLDVDSGCPALGTPPIKQRRKSLLALEPVRED